MLFRSWSRDEAKTWTKPSSNRLRGVEPCLWLMKNGILALSTGRPDPVHGAFQYGWGSDLDPIQRNCFKKGAHDYTGMVEVEPDKLLVVYDHVPFNWGVIPENEPNSNELHSWDLLESF